MNKIILILFFFLVACETTYIFEFSDKKNEETDIYVQGENFITLLYLHIIKDYKKTDDTVIIKNFSINVFINKDDSIFLPVKVWYNDSDFLTQKFILPNQSTEIYTVAEFRDTNGYYLFDTNKYQVLIDMNYEQNGKKVTIRDTFEAEWTKKFCRYAKRMSGNKYNCYKLCHSVDK